MEESMRECLVMRSRKDMEFSYSIFIYIIMSSANGEKYEGEFKDNMRHGKGTLLDEDYNIQKGYWNNDVFEA